MNFFLIGTRYNSLCKMFYFFILIFFCLLFYVKCKSDSSVCVPSVCMLCFQSTSRRRRIRNLSVFSPMVDCHSFSVY